MSRPIALGFVAAVALSAPAFAQQEARPAAPAVAGQPAEGSPIDSRADDPTDVLGFTMTDIRGSEQPLDEYRGKVVLIVNVASKCGLTPQYEGLQKLYKAHKDRGLVILGFPANDFRGQEPGTDEEILEFCSARYGVDFPMFSKVSVTGEERHPLYAKLAAAMEDQGGEPTWNFTKYLVDREGDVVVRFDPQTSPQDEKLLAEIERLLAEPAPGASGDGSDAPAVGR